MTTPKPTTQRAVARPALDDSDLTKIRFSPTCTYCSHWKPEDNQHCAGAYPRGGPEIPDAIWSGKVTHVFPYAGDHGVQFHAAAGAKVPANIRADLAKRAAQEKGG